MSRSVEHGRMAGERPERFGKRGQALGPLVAAPAVELYLAAVLDDLEAIAVDGELCLPGPGGTPDFRGLQGALTSRGDELAVYVFDLVQRDEDDLTDAPLTTRKQLLTRLVGRDFPCLHPVQTFEDGAKLLAAAERHGLEGIVSKRKASPYRSGPSRDWVKTKTSAWRVANRDRWKAFQRSR